VSQHPHCGRAVQQIRHRLSSAKHAGATNGTADGRKSGSSDIVTVTGDNAVHLGEDVGANTLVVCGTVQEVCDRLGGAQDTGGSDGAADCACDGLSDIIAITSDDAVHFREDLRTNALVVGSTVQEVGDGLGRAQDTGRSDSAADCAGDRLGDVITIAGDNAVHFREDLGADAFVVGGAVEKVCYRLGGAEDASAPDCTTDCADERLGNVIYIRRQ